MATSIKNKEIFCCSIESNLGLKKDRWGHYKFSGAGNELRIKVCKTKWRLERKRGSGWFRLQSAFFSDQVATNGLLEQVLRLQAN